MSEWVAAFQHHLSKLDWRSELIVRMRNALPVKLPGRQDEVVFEKAASLRKCAEVVGISYERVRQLEVKAMTKLQKLVPAAETIDSMEEMAVNTAGYAKKS